MNAFSELPSPWYRQLWPWLLMAGPTIVIVAGLVTAAMAIESFDGLVADDYYRQGKAINMTLHRREMARKLGYVADLSMATEGNSIRLAFSGTSPAAPTLTLTFAHPTRGGQDRVVILTHLANGQYAATLPSLAPAHWQLVLEDASHAWRLTGMWQTGTAHALLKAAP